MWIKGLDDKENTFIQQLFQVIKIVEKEMRSTLFLAFLLFIVIAAVNCGPLPSNATNELMKDGGSNVLVAEEDGNNGVKLIGRGYVELVVANDSLVVGVNLDSCKGKVLFCYAAKSGKMMKAAEDLCLTWPGSCGFKLDGTSDNITFTRDTFTKDELVNCKNDVEIEMKYSSTEYCGHHDSSCNAEILQEDRRIGIHVQDFSYECPVTIKYAKIYVPPTTTTPIPTTAAPLMTTSSNGTIAKHDKAAEASSEMWAWIVLCCVIGLIVLGIIGGILLCWFNDWCMFKKKTGENLPPLHPVESIVSATVEAKAEEKIEQAYEKIKSEHPELKEVISKKSKKAQPAPPPPSAEQVKKSPPPALGKSAKKEKKAKTPPPPTPAAAPSKNAPKEKKPAPASPGKKSVEKKAAPSKETTEKPCSSTQSYSPEFCILAVRTPSPPRKPIDPKVLLERRRRRKENDSLELYAAEREKKHKAASEAIKKRHPWM